MNVFNPSAIHSNMSIIIGFVFLNPTIIVVIILHHRHHHPPPPPPPPPPPLSSTTTITIILHRHHHYPSSSSSPQIGVHPDRQSSKKVWMWKGGRRPIVKRRAGEVSVVLARRDARILCACVRASLSLSLSLSLSVCVCVFLSSKEAWVWRIRRGV